MFNKNEGRTCSTKACFLLHSLSFSKGLYVVLYTVICSFNLCVNELDVYKDVSVTLKYIRKAIILYKNTYLDSLTVVIHPCKLI